MFENTSSSSARKVCEWCGGYHETMCPTVKAIEYYADGSVKRVEFKSAQDYNPLTGWPFPPFVGPMPVTC